MRDRSPDYASLHPGYGPARRNYPPTAPCVFTYSA